MDTIGLLLAVVVHPADIQDRDGAKLVIDKMIGRFPRLRLVWADADYAGKLIEWVWTLTGWALEIVKRPRDSHQFEVLPRRWVVERTFAWLSRCRRLSKDYEALSNTTEAWINIAMIHLMLRRLAPFMKNLWKHPLRDIGGRGHHEAVSLPLNAMYAAFFAFQTPVVSGRLSR